jgi:hypothetical protein
LHRSNAEVATVRDLPFVVLFGEQGPDEAQERGPVREDADDVGPPLDLLVEPLEWVRRVEPAPVLRWEMEVGKQIL